MADPISLLAVAGLIYTGRNLSNKLERTAPEVIEEIDFSEVEPEYMEEFGDAVADVSRKYEVTSFAELAPQQRSSGQEVLGMRDRMFDRGRMNNLSPVEKSMVGPGLNVGYDTPAQGGYQQLFRVNPVNVGEHRLTTLPGRTGPAHDTRGYRAPVVGQLTHNMPEKTAFLPSRRPSVFGRAQGMTGVTPRQEHERTKRTTNRAETGMRTDGLETAPAKRLVPQGAVQQDPTRFKGDLTDSQFKYNNHPTPGIHSFHGGYTNTPEILMSSTRTNEDLQKYGFRPEDRREKVNRMANPGRMNVRAGPLNQGGQVTTVRSDTTRIDGRINAPNGGWTQQYQQKPYHQFNAYKGNENPYANNMSLNIAKKQLESNPFSSNFC
jgi:hypothetical protein